MREYPVRLPLPFPDEAYINPSTFNKSLTSSTCHWERTKGIHADWGKLNKSQNAVLSKIRSLVEEIDKLAPKLTYEDQVFYNDFNNYLVSLMPHVASHKPVETFQPNINMVLRNESKSPSIISHVLKQ